MKKKHVKRILFLIASLFILSACNIGVSNPNADQPGAGTSEPAPTPQTASGGLCDNILFPIKQGASWTYLNTGSPSGDFTYTDTITELRTDGFTLTSQFTGLTRTQEWQCTPEGLKALQLGGAGSAANISTQGTSAEFTTKEVTGISLPKEVTPGLQWTYSLTMEGFTAMPDNQMAQSTGTFNFTMQEMGRETITVPAGTFEAVKFQSTSLVQIIADFQGIQVPVTINGSSTIWYAPGVGFIKSIENSDYGGAPFTSTTELQSYSIP